MVTLRVIFLCAVTALALLGACKDVPIDPDTGRVVPPDTTKDTTHTPVQHHDTCRDCAPAREYKTGHRMWFAYKKKVGSQYRIDTVEVELAGAPLKPVRRNDGSMVLSLRVDADIPSLENSFPEYWGAHVFTLIVPEINISPKGEGEVELVSKDLNRARLIVPYMGIWNNDPDVRYLSTGDRFSSGPGVRVSRGSFKVERVDSLGRFVDASLYVKFFLPEGAHQKDGNDYIDVFELIISGDIRLSLQ